MKEVEAKYNPAYLPYFETQNRIAFVYGGAGSGKSRGIAQKHVMRANNGPKERFLVLRKVRSSLQESTFRELRTVCQNWGLSPKINRSDLSFLFGNGSEIIHAGLDDPEKLKSIADVTSIWIEEATQLDPYDWAQVRLRLRGTFPSYGQITLSFNPIRKSHHLRQWIDEHPEAFVLRTTHEDNYFLDEDYRQELRNLPERLRKVYERGEWGEEAAGLIYPEFNVVDDWPSVDDTCYGLDFGFTNPTSLVHLGLRDDTELYMDEVIYSTRLHNSDLIDKMKALGISTSTPIYADAAEPQRIEEIALAGFNIFPADKDVLKGIDSVSRRNIHVTRRSANILGEIEEYSWHEDKDGNLVDKPIKFRDHAMDAGRYGVHTAWGLPTPKDLLTARVAL